MNKIRGIAAEGGGILGIGHVGALEELENAGVPLDKLEVLAGSSAGAIVVAALACRASVAFLKTMLLQADFEKFKDSSWNYCADAIGLVRKYGWYYGDAVENWVGEAMLKLTDNADITLKQAHDRYGSHLIITATQVGIEGCRTLYLDYLNSPDLPIRSAVRRSISIPLFYRAVFDKVGDVPAVLMDGGILYNYPIGVLYKYLDPSEVVGLKLVSTAETPCAHNTRDITEANLTAPTNIVQAMTSIISALRDQALKYHVHSVDWERTVKIDVGNISAISFKLTSSQSSWLLDQGRVGARAWVSSIVY